MAPVIELGAPVRVSPFIRACRWGFLVTGIFYGMYHQGRFTKKENALREIEAKERPIREAKLAAEKTRLLAEEIKYLESLSSPAAK